MKKTFLSVALLSAFVMGTTSVEANHGKINAHPYSYCNGKIKGNISSSGEKIYHIPGGQYYNKTKAEYCFDTTAQAKKAGFRASKR